MAYSSLHDLLIDIYEEIKILNTGFGKNILPLSGFLCPHLAKKFGLDADKVPQLLTAIVNAKMVFEIPVIEVNDDGKGEAGYVATKGNVLSAVKTRCEESLEHEYSNQFQRKDTAERILKEYSAKRAEFNNSPFGIALSVVLMLEHNQHLLERNIMQYSDRTLRTALDNETQKCFPLSFYLNGGTAPDEKNCLTEKPCLVPPDTHISDNSKTVSRNNPVDKALKLYGIEMYTHLCFREYKFKIVAKLIDDGKIHKENDLLIVKKLIDEKRITADEDPRINEFAAEVNLLVKSVNAALKRCAVQ